jgi:hypothetical protein
LVRKSLGRHEIATVQATSIDERAGGGPVNHDAGAFLRRMALLGLAGLSDQRNDHPASDGSRPHYARRYAPFTLVGIAGEDDLDAPDLNGALPHPASFASPANF